MGVRACQSASQMPAPTEEQASIPARQNTKKNGARDVVLDAGAPASAGASTWVVVDASPEQVVQATTLVELSLSSSAGLSVQDSVGGDGGPASMGDGFPCWVPAKLAARADVLWVLLWAVASPGCATAKLWEAGRMAAFRSVCWASRAGSVAGWFHACSAWGLDQLGAAQATRREPPWKAVAAGPVPWLEV